MTVRNEQMITRLPRRGFSRLRSTRLKLLSMPSKTRSTRSFTKCRIMRRKKRTQRRRRKNLPRLLRGELIRGRSWNRQSLNKNIILLLNCISRTDCVLLGFPGTLKVTRKKMTTKRQKTRFSMQLKTPRRRFCLRRTRRNRPWNTQSRMKSRPSFQPVRTKRPNELMHLSFNEYVCIAEGLRMDEERGKCI